MYTHLFIFFVLGLAIGSFLNVLVYRMNTGETFFGRSMCRNCKKTIAFYDNIPFLSFLFLKGKCRHCHEKISWQYPLVELVTGSLFVLVGYYFFLPFEENSWIEIFWLMGIVSILLSIATYDLRFMEIPISLLVVGGVWTLLFLLLMGNEGDMWWSTRIGSGIIGGALVALFFFALVYASKEKWMGWGDVWLGGIAGMVVGLPLVLFMLTLSFGVGAILGVLSMLFGDKGLKSQVPFAPFLVTGTLLSLFLPKILPEFMQLFLL